jgi:MFS family permease
MAEQPNERAPGDYRWSALSNTTLGVLMAMMNSSIVLISLTAIFRGIRLDPLQPGNVGYLLWMIMGYLLVTAVLVVTLGKVGDILGRVRMYNAGFVVFTAASVGLGLVRGQGGEGAMELILLRLVQAVGGALLMANSAAILTDAFPRGQRGLALGLNQVAGLAGSFIGLIVGGLLADWSWRAVFFVSVPIGLFGTIWAYVKLPETGERLRARIDWLGNLTFAAGLTLLLLATTYGIQPAGGHVMAWASWPVLAALAAGVALLIAFVFVEHRVAEPMFDLKLFRIRPFAAGNLALLLFSVARGGLQFVLILWLQGIWLPLHGYAYASTPLWAGLYMTPLTLGFLVAGPVSGFLSDRFGARAFATGGLLLTAATFAGLAALPVDFRYAPFAVLLFLNGVGSGLFAAPNTAAIMSSVPPAQRGAVSGMRATFQNGGMVLSMGIFFSLVIAGLARRMPAEMQSGLVAHGVSAATADRLARLPPVGSLFAAFLGYNPMRQLLGPELQAIPRSQAETLTGMQFFPRLMSGPFHHGLTIVFAVAIALSLLAAVASALRGKEAPRAGRRAGAMEGRPAEA